MYDKVMEDLDKFFDEKHNRDKKLKFFVEIETSDVNIEEHPFIFPEPIQKKKTIVRVATKRKGKDSKDNLF
jgi:hypothetical protein